MQAKCIRCLAANRVCLASGVTVEPRNRPQSGFITAAAPRVCSANPPQVKFVGYISFFSFFVGFIIFVFLFLKRKLNSQILTCSTNFNPILTYKA